MKVSELKVGMLVRYRGRPLRYTGEHNYSMGREWYVFDTYTRLISFDEWAIKAMRPEGVA